MIANGFATEEGYFVAVHQLSVESNRHLVRLVPLTACGMSSGFRSKFPFSLGFVSRVTFIKWFPVARNQFFAQQVNGELIVSSGHELGDA